MATTGLSFAQMRSHLLLRSRCAVAAVPALVALHLAWADTPSADADAGSANMPWLSPGLRFAAPPTFGDRHAGGEVRWQRQDGSSQWFARVSMGSLRLPQIGSAERLDVMAKPPPAPSLQGEAQWLYRGWEGHEVRLGANARHDLLLPQVQAATLGAYLQDEWSVAPGWRLALGLRSDAAPDATTALTPRAALSWQARPDLQVKLIDGVIWRDPHLSPWQDAAMPGPRLIGGMRLRASELALNWQVSDGLRLATSLHRQRDAQAVAAAAPGSSAPALRFSQATHAAAGDGIGIEGDYGVADGWRLRARWAAFNAAAAADSAGTSARVFAALQAHTPLPWRGASAGIEWLRIDQRGGALALTQTLLNARLSWAPAGSPWSLAANAYNLADHALADAALAPQDVLVREGRRWQVQVARAF